MIHILTLWLLIQAKAPIWCYIILAFDFTYRLIRGAYKAGKESEK